MNSMVRDLFQPLSFFSANVWQYFFVTRIVFCTYIHILDIYIEQLELYLKVMEENSPEETVKYIDPISQAQYVYRQLQVLLSAMDNSKHPNKYRNVEIVPRNNTIDHESVLESYRNSNIDQELGLESNDIPMTNNEIHVDIVVEGEEDGNKRTYPDAPYDGYGFDIESNNKRLHTEIITLNDIMTSDIIDQSTVKDSISIDDSVHNAAIEDFTLLSIPTSTTMETTSNDFIRSDSIPTDTVTTTATTMIDTNHYIDTVTDNVIVNADHEDDLIQQLDKVVQEWNTSINTPEWEEL
jgi:antitoxin component of RelBE/YafQ-DinJ toxin-antitoxin module